MCGRLGNDWAGIRVACSALCENMTFGGMLII